MKTRDGLALASAVAAIALLGAPAAAQGPTVEVLAEGLNAPRGLSVAPTAASWSPRPGPPARRAWRARAAQACFGPSGAVTKIADGSVERVIEGLHVGWSRARDRWESRISLWLMTAPSTCS